MTPQEAIERLRKIPIRPKPDNALDLQAICIAKKALEKQIPKKPIIENGYIECPYCHTDIEEDKGNWYCSICGQRIDWSKAE